MSQPVFNLVPQNPQMFNIAPQQGAPAQPQQFVPFAGAFTPAQQQPQQYAAQVPQQLQPQTAQRFQQPAQPTAFQFSNSAAQLDLNHFTAAQIASLQAQMFSLGIAQPISNAKPKKITADQARKAQIDSIVKGQDRKHLQRLDLLQQYTAVDLKDLLDKAAQAQGIMPPADWFAPV